jgi:hypothetical protein
MGYPDYVWVSKANVDEVDGQQGMVEVDSDLGEQLIKDGKAQDPRDGALFLAEIEDAPRKRRRKQTKQVKADDLETVAVEPADADGSDDGTE